MSYDQWAGVSDAGMVAGEAADTTDLADLIGIRDSYPCLRPELSASQVRTIAIRTVAEVMTDWLYRHGAARVEWTRMMRIGIRLVDDHRLSTRSIATACRCSVRTAWRIRNAIIDRIYMQVCGMVNHDRPADAEAQVEEVGRVVDELLEPSDIGETPMARWSIGEAWGTPWGRQAEEAEDSDAMRRARYIARHSGGATRREREAVADISRDGNTERSEIRNAQREAHNVARIRIHELTRRIRQVSDSIREAPERYDLRAERVALRSERQELQDWLTANLRTKLAS